MGKDKSLIIQWMWRGNLNNDLERIKGFHKNKHKIVKLFSKLKKNGFIKKIYMFPYTKKFLSKCKNDKIFNGYCVYRNPKEKSFDKLIKLNYKKNFIIIQPFGGSYKLLKKHSLRYLINYSKKYKNIKKIIFSCSKVNQVNQILELNNVKKII